MIVYFEALEHYKKEHVILKEVEVLTRTETSGILTAT